MRLPTTVADWRYAVGVVAEVQRKPVYAAFTLLTAFVALTVFVVPGNFSLVTNVVVFGDAAVTDRLKVLADLYPFFGEALVTSLLLVSAAVLIGVNISVLVHGYMNGSVGGAGGSAAGTTLATLGAGCAACGSAVLAAFFSATAVAGALAFLPFGGSELVAGGVVVLALSVFWAADATRDACAV